MQAQAAQQQLNIDELRMQISQALSSSAAFSQAVYQEQPIIMTGRQLKSFVPDAIREARALARAHFAHHRTQADVFYAQACLLAGYEDDFEFTSDFSRYYPTYEDMSNEELRGYFSWRTKVRQGSIERGSLSFAYLYLYELIHLIGVESAQAGFEAMHAFGSAYRRFDARFGRTCAQWLDDFVIYYGLDPSLLSTHGTARHDAAFGVLEQCDTQPDDALFDALLQLSSYDMASSPFFLEHEAELRQLVTHVYRHAKAHHDAKLKTSLAAKLLGRPRLERYRPFERAVFANPLGMQQKDYAISVHNVIRCRNGIWTEERYPKLATPLSWVTQLLETCECILRDAYAYPNLLERSLNTKYLVKEAESRAHAIVESARAREARAVHIDFGKLDHIRRAASKTCEKLIVEDEQVAPVFAADGVSNMFETKGTGDAPEPRSKKAGCQGAAIEAKTSQPRDVSPRMAEGGEAFPLDAHERELVKTLLNGGSIREFEHAHACIASVLVDSINEKLYDEFADICIDSSADTPTIIEDYAEELRAMLG